MRAAGRAKRGSGLPEPNGAEALEHGEELAGRRRRGERAVDRELRHRRRAADLGDDALGEEIAQRVELVGRDGEAGRHGMAAAIDQQPRLARRDDRGAERDARRPSGPSPCRSPSLDARRRRPAG